MSQPNNAALIVFAKVPEPGKVKTRLTELLTPAQAAGLYAAFLADALAQYTAVGVHVRLYLSPTETPMPAGIVPETTTVHTQVGADLGPRMSHAFLETFLAGYARAVIIGTDHPTLPSAFIQEAFGSLAEDPYSIVIGPSEDGGYYLLGMNEFYPQVFEDMTYSQDRVFEETIQRADTSGAGVVSVLPTWYDVDTPDELIRLIHDLPNADPSALPRTRDVLGALVKAYPALGR
ncbi:MAG: TIGR04282 family arsenosugar biosynthesis glycosyltransferase [Rhodothermales bacterium]|nr:TIGR04282 family arsenosugar biosynthesis glycosyltransferase [Rhodothermales bacterium]